MPSAAEIYRWLMSAGERTICDGFDAHVVASAFALGMEAVGEHVPLPDSLGLPVEEIRELISPFFPHGERLLDCAVSTELKVSEDETMLRDLLFRGSSSGSDLERRLAAIIARRCLQPHHLWQDMGLRNRRELSWLLAGHFESLANRNTNDMKWKKFLYRAICRDTGYTLCVAPTCGECDDYQQCFGEEAGDCLLGSKAQADVNQHCDR